MTASFHRGLSWVLLTKACSLEVGLMLPWRQRYERHCRCRQAYRGLPFRNPFQKEELLHQLGFSHQQLCLLNRINAPSGFG